MIDINGKWIGVYSYDTGYSEVTKLQAVPFNATIETGLKEFIGQITEEVEYGGLDDEIVIRGQLKGNEIEFVKYYTLEHTLDENGESYSFESDSPNIVHYSGKYFENEKKFKGRWELPGLREDDDGVFHEDNSSGNWEMWRESWNSFDRFAQGKKLERHTKHAGR